MFRTKKNARFLETAVKQVFFSLKRGDLLRNIHINNSIKKGDFNYCKASLSCFQFLPLKRQKN